MDTKDAATLVAERDAVLEELQRQLDAERARVAAYLATLNAADGGGVIPEYARQSDPIGALITSHKRLRDTIRRLRSR